MEMNIVAGWAEVLNQQTQHVHAMTEGGLMSFERIIRRPYGNPVKVVC
jgi:hypothetical protein